MQKPVFYSALFLLMVTACNKDKFQTKPSLTLKGISTNHVFQNENMYVDLEFTDKEGDIQDTLWVQKIRLNQDPLPTVRDEFPMDLTTTGMPDKRKGQIRLLFNYQFHIIAAEDPGDPPNAVPDTIIYKFVLTDEADNKSDTITTEPIIVDRQ